MSDPAAAEAALRQYINGKVDQLKAERPVEVNLSALDGSSRLSPTAVLNLAARCAPATPATALLSIAQAESGLAPLSIHVNGVGAHMLRPVTQAQAIARAQTLIGQGRSLDLGLAQINSRNLGWLGLSVEQAFDPCRNLAAAAQILDRGYVAALNVQRANLPLLQMAYSIYNTGPRIKAGGTAMSTGLKARAALSPGGLR